eukprot:1927046-Prymnesium_polylepis.1
MAAAWLRWRAKVGKWREALDTETGKLLESALAGTASGSARAWVRHAAITELAKPSITMERTAAA